MNAIKQYIREDLRSVRPYSSARDEYNGTAGIWLDANENPSITTWNRYPDPLQQSLKEVIAKEKKVATDALFLGNGSDEVLDLLFRLIARPFTDKVAFFDPSYGMYEVLTTLNGLEQVRIPLKSDFTPDWELTQTAIQGTQLFVVCRPNNPTGNLFDRSKLLDLLTEYTGVMIVDEAYIDFSSENSLAELIDEFPNLIIVQTLSKAYGMAGLRVGMAIANPEWIAALNSIKPPYNISSIVQQEAIKQLREQPFSENRAMLIRERERVSDALKRLSIVQKTIDSEANFILFKVENPDKLYAFLSENGVVVRNRSKQLNCEGMLRVSIGTPEENDRFVELLNVFES